MGQKCFGLLLLFAILSACGSAFDHINSNSLSQYGLMLQSSCYYGSTCFPVIEKTNLQLKKDYPDPFQERDFPKKSNPYQYIAPTFFLNLTQANLEKSISPYFKASDFMGSSKDVFGVLSRRLVQALDQMKRLYGNKFTISSGYRSPSYNSKIKEATKWSRHQYGDAVDLIPKGISLRQLGRLCRKQDASFIQIYKSHVHCDWREAPLDKDFYITGHNHSYKPHTLISEHSHASIKRIIKNRQIHLSILSSEVNKEDSGDLYVQWTIITPHKNILEFESPTVTLPIHSGLYIARAEFSLDELLEQEFIIQ